MGKTYSCPDCRNIEFYIEDARLAKPAKVTPVKAFRELHAAWLGASHRNDMNAEMDALAKALGLDPFTLKPVLLARQKGAQ